MNSHTAPGEKAPFPRPGDISLIAIDIDGTILNSKSKLPARVADAIGKAAAAGYTVLPATGRQLNGIPREVLAIPGFRYVIASNGAKVYDLERDEVLLSDCFTKEAAGAVLRDCLAIDALVGVYMEGVGYSQKRSLAPFEGILTSQFLEYYKNTRIEVEDLPGLLAASTGDIEKFSLHFADLDLRLATKAAFEQRKDLSVTSSARTNLEFGTPTVSKGAALSKLAGRLGIPKERVMAVGNNMNDAAMLLAAGHAVAMGNASDEVKALAHTVAPTNNEDGVAVILERLMADA